MQCTAGEIAEKKRQALERLKQRKQATENKPIAVNNNIVQSSSTSLKATSGFYGNASSSKATALDNYENKLKHTPSHATSNRILSQPYSTRDSKHTTAAADTINLANIFKTVVTCSCSLVSAKRFEVKTTGFLEQLISVFKSIASRSYGMVCHFKATR